MPDQARHDEPITFQATAKIDGRLKRWAFQFRFVSLEPVLEVWIRPDNKAESGSKAEHIWNM